MTTVVITAKSDLTLALAAKTSVVGVAPDDLEWLLSTTEDVNGAIVDVGSDGTTLRQAVRTVRSAAPAIPILVIGEWAEGALDHDDDLIAAIDRPFTIGQLISVLEGLRHRGPQHPAEPARDESTNSTATPAATIEAPPPGESPTRPKRRRGAHSAAGLADRRRVASVDEAIEVLLALGDAYTVTEISLAISDVLADSMDAANAVLVLDEGWSVTAGRGLRSVERRAVIPRGHWLARRLSDESAVVVDGTDIARQELAGLPHIQLNYWIATKLAGTPAIIVLAREEGPFTVADAIRVRDMLTPFGPELRRAISLRSLARRLEPFNS